MDDNTQVSNIDATPEVSNDSSDVQVNTVPESPAPSGSESSETPVLTDDMLLRGDEPYTGSEGSKAKAGSAGAKDGSEGSEAKAGSEGSRGDDEVKDTSKPSPEAKAGSVGAEANRDAARREKARQNNINAQRRIREREERKQKKLERIDYLRKELARLEDDNKAAVAIEDSEGKIRSQLRMESVNDRLDEAYTEMEQERYDNFRSDVYEQFGGNEAAASDAVELIGKYTPYVNKNEPLVLKMTQRENGYLTLTAWCKAMNTQNFRDKWLTLLPSEKEKVLLAISGTIHKTLNAPSSGRASASYGSSASFGSKGNAPAVQKNAPKDVPVPKSGHDVMSTSIADDDFGSALQQIRNQRMAKFV